MSRAKRIAVCGIMSALAVVFLLIGVYTTFTFTASFLAAVCLIANAALAPKNFVYVFISYTVTVITAGFITGQYLEIMTFALLLAPFTVAKYYADNSQLNKIFRWVIKIIVFEIYLVAYLLIFYFVFIESWNAVFTKDWYLWIVIACGQVALVAYDIIFTYIIKWLKTVLPKFFRR